ncbi:MAG: hypothetical protein RL519_1258 [Pseudomonadota bacterium]
MRAHLYLLVMKRILLAMLALMTGLVAQAGPVQARMNGGADTEIGVSDGSRGSARPSQVQVQAIDAPAALKERRERQATRIRPSRGRIYIPSVLFGPDRALE